MSDPSFTALPADQPGIPQSAGSDFDPSAYPPPAPPQRRPRGLLIGVIGGGVVLAALIVVGVLGYLAHVAADAPAVSVKNFFTALEHGHADKALQLDGITVKSSDVLLTDQAYNAAHGHLSDVTIEATRYSGDKAVVTARFVQSGEYFTQKFQLDAVGKDLLVITTWKLQPVRLGTVTVQMEGPQASLVTVDGVAVSAPAASVRLRALPGQYSVDLTAQSTWYSSTAGVAWVNGFGASDDQAANIATTLTPAGVASATAAVNAWVAGCIASPDVAPAGCSFSVLNNPPARDFTHQKWTLASAPAFSVGAWTGTGWAVSTTSPGSATYFADAVDSSGPITFTTASPATVDVGGSITSVTDAGATFVSQPWTF
jgi:hypothetical protein